MCTLEGNNLDTDTISIEDLQLILNGLKRYIGIDKQDQVRALIDNLGNYNSNVFDFTMYSRTIQSSKISDPERISYMWLKVNQTNSNDMLSTISDELNVAKPLGNEGQNFIFNPPENFENWKNESKILLYGQAGCGKSRSILEILRDKINYSAAFLLHSAMHSLTP